MKQQKNDIWHLHASLQTRVKVTKLYIKDQLIPLVEYFQILKCNRNELPSEFASTITE